VTRTHVFTPYGNATSGRRVLLNIGDEDKAKVPRGRWGPCEVTDVTTGTTVRVQSTSCGSGGCHCAAEIIEITVMGEGPLPYVD